MRNRLARLIYALSLAVATAYARLENSLRRLNDRLDREPAFFRAATTGFVIFFIGVAAMATTSYNPFVAKEGATIQDGGTVYGGLTVPDGGLNVVTGGATIAGGASITGGGYVDVFTAASVDAGSVTASTVTPGAGQGLTGLRLGTATSPAALAANTCGTNAVAVPGAAIGDGCLVKPPSGTPGTGIVATCNGTGAGTATLTTCNARATTSTPTSGTWTLVDFEGP